MRPTNSPNAEPQNEFVPRRPRKVVQWVEHFFSCSVCLKPNTSMPMEARTRSELCPEGRRRLDLWLDEE